LSIEFSTGVTGLLGINGAGKSTLMRTCSGLLRPTIGTVAIGEADPYKGSTRKSALRGIALVPQEFDFPRHFTLRDYLLYMAWMREVGKSDRKRSAISAATEVGLQDKLDVKLAHLSGGMLRRAAIAQAILANPSVILFDEPTAGLDPDQRATVRELVAKIGSNRCAVFASHIVEDVAYVADRIVVLHRGRILYDGDVDGITDHRSGDAASGGSTLEQGFLTLIRSGH
jgi:ABC-2 type transport system ATP-binding protein